MPKAEHTSQRSACQALASSRLPAPMVAQIEFLEGAIGLQRRAFNFRRWVADAGTTGRIFASRTLRHDCCVGFLLNHGSPSFFDERECSRTHAHRSIEASSHRCSSSTADPRGLEGAAAARLAQARCGHAQRAHVGVHAPKPKILPRSGCCREPVRSPPSPRPLPKKLLSFCGRMMKSRTDLVSLS